jgi:probable rRNA maturation factor
VSLRLCDDAEIQEINKEWRQKNEPTDVLSFPQFEMPLPSWAPTLGDVLISLETASRQAQSAGHSLSDELVVLLTHGMLHLLGFDHIEDDERAEMAAAENALLKPRGLRSGLIGRSRA